MYELYITFGPYVSKNSIITAVNRLKAIFPSGVCDFSRRGVGYRPVVTWPSFGPSRDNLVFDVTNQGRGDDQDD